jgi:hypothetical protein
LFLKHCVSKGGTNCNSSHTALTVRDAQLDWRCVPTVDNNTFMSRTKLIELANRLHPIDDSCLGIVVQSSRYEYSVKVLCESQKALRSIKPRVHEVKPSGVISVA